MAWLAFIWRLSGKLMLTLALVSALTGCAPPVGRPHYVSADSSVDPFSSVRAKAEEYYQAGLADERNGDWKKALDDFQQASMWDHDGRQDIADELSRAQAQVDWQTYRTVGSSSSTRSPVSSPSSTQAPEATSAARTATQPPTSTAAARSEPMKRFDSQNFPYTVSFPQSWVEQSGGSSQAPADIFFDASGAKSDALVIISAEPAGFSVTLDELYAATAQTLKTGGIKNVEIVDRRRVAGLPAYVLSYLDTTASGTVSVHHAIFVTPDRAWHVILLAPSVTTELDQKFNAMLDSFELRPSAFPVQ